MSRGEIAEIGKYRILGQIGEGAMGVVYRALDPVLNRHVAIKVMSEALARDNDLRSRFLREAQSAGSLQHPNVITIYDFGEVDGHPFIAMEFVEGADLNQVLESDTPLSLVEKLDVLIDVLNGLSYAHKRGIVHRDIKPANIRIDEEGRARIMDFGIAHLSSSNMTRTGVMVGTPAYMSPEQITGGAIAATSDIFGTGAVMYELLTGEQAFRGESLQTVMYKIVSAPTPELKLIAPDLSESRNTSISHALDTIVARALEKEPSDRYDNALEMAAALTEVRARVLESEPSTSTSLRVSVAKLMAEAPEMKERRARRRRIMWGAVAAVAAVAIVSVRLYSSGGSAATNPTTPAIAARAADAPPSTPTPGAVPPKVAAESNTPVITASPSKASQTTATPRELGLFRALQTTALAARRRASDAGASADQLSAGDGHNKIANVLVAQGKTAEAGEHLNEAASAWSAAERTVRAVAAAGARTVVADVPKQQVASSVVAAAPATVSQPAPPVQQAQQAASPPASTPAADIGAAVAAYARALETRDVAAVRHAYPGITPMQAKGWEQFFSTLRSLRVSLTVNGLDVSGSTADAKLMGAYDYVTEAGKSAQQPVSFQASFRRDGSAWQLVSVH
ncbi:MAG: serine/threonine-protein kinase [bacterium]